MSNEINPANPDPSPFERIRQQNESGNDFWSSRALAALLGYSDYRNFEAVIKKAQTSCFNSGQRVDEHFGEYNEMFDIGNNAKREVKSVMLSRYACYLIIQNADPAKEIVAGGQTYFAVQTRRQEIGDQAAAAALAMEEDEKRIFLRREVEVHNKRLAGVAKTAGVVRPIEFAIFQNHGYQGLYGGLTMGDIHRKKRLPKGKKILDHMGSTELAANLFRATQTEDKIKRENIQGKEAANKAHYQVGAKVRQTIKDIGGAMPEDLPSVEDVRKVGRRATKPKEIENK